MRIFDAIFVWVACAAVLWAELSAARRPAAARVRKAGVVFLFVAATAYVAWELSRWRW